MKSPIIDRKYLIVDWNPVAMKYQRFRFKHHADAHSIYLRILALEFAVWYR